jgi:hypothetical protein
MQRVYLDVVAYEIVMRLSRGRYRRRHRNRRELINRFIAMLEKSEYAHCIDPDSDSDPDTDFITILTMEYNDDTIQD